MKSLDLFVMLDNLVKFGEFGLLVFVELLHNESLRVNAVVHLLVKLLKGSCHPVTVVVSCLNPFLLHLLSDLAPDLSHLEVRVHLNHLQLLLFVGCEVVACESYSIQNGKDDQSHVKGFHFFSNPIHKVCLGSSLSKIF